MKRFILALSIFAATAHAEPVRVPAPGGEVVAVDQAQFDAQYGGWHYAPARVEGKLIFLSGVVAGARDGKPLDVAGFEAALRRAFGQIDKILAAAGSDGSHIVDMTTYHVFNSPLANFDKAAHIDAVRRVRDEFVKPPYSSWTGIGVAELFPAAGLIEIKVTARKKD